VLHSPTDLDRTRCERYYAFYHFGPELGYEREPKTDSLNLGIELHEIAENYLENGAQPDRLTLAGDMFIAALPYLPAPGSGGVEGQRDLKIAGQEYSMKIDYRGPLPNLAGRWVLDHKTSKNPKAYGLWQKHTTGAGTRAEKKGFLNDTQALLVALQDLVETGDPTTNLLWLYYKVPTGASAKREACPSYITLEKNEVLDAFGEHVHVKAELAQKLRLEKTHPLSLAPNPKQCHAFNRECHYANICNLSLQDKLVTIGKKTNMGLLEKAAKKIADAETGNTNSKPAPAAEAKKEDRINPPEAAAPKSAKADIAPKSASGDTKPAPANTLSVNSRTLAIFAQRIGEALVVIAADLRK
jgi:hypothetical protein